jgi:hypothetical protein
LPSTLGHARLPETAIVEYAVRLKKGKNMDDLNTYANVITHALCWAKSIKDLLPKKERTRVDTFIDELKVKETSLAEEMGYPLCRCTWPPTIMLKCKDELYEYHCPACGQEGALGQLRER